jgi:hypothetical protein
VLKSIFELGSTNGWQNFLHLSKKPRVVIGMETGEFVLQA